MNAKHYNGEPGDPMEWDLRNEFEICQMCGADATDPCEVGCRCPHCELQRLRVMDVNPEGDAA